MTALDLSSRPAGCGRLSPVAVTFKRAVERNDRSAIRIRQDRARCGQLGQGKQSFNVKKRKWLR